MKRLLGPIIGVAIGLLIGGLYALNTSVEHNQKRLKALTDRVTAIEEREREASKARARLDERMLQVHRDLDMINKKLEIILSAYQGEKT